MNSRSRRERWVLRNRRKQNVYVYDYVTSKRVTNNRYSGMSLRLIKAFLPHYEGR